MTDQVTELSEYWDKINKAIDRVVCAIPEQMTQAAADLETAKGEFRHCFQKFAMAPDFRNGLKQSFDNMDKLLNKLSALANGNGENPEAWPDEETMGQELGSFYRLNKNLKLLYKDV